MNNQQFAAFRKLIHSLTGVTIAETRRAMVISRVSSRMRAMQVDDIDSYYALILDDTAEKAQFIDRITTHETYFFRTPRVWAYIEQRFLPMWLKENVGRTLRVWSAACSTGEEAYSAAMLLHDYATHKSKLNFHVFGSDVSQGVVDKAEKGIYQGRSIDRLSKSRPEFLQRYLEPTEDRFSVVQDLRRHVDFDVHSLFSASPKTHTYDLVLCRNVMIYFDREDQRAVIGRLRSAMRENAVLVIGESESLQTNCNEFVDVEPLVFRAFVPEVAGQVAIS